MTIQPAFLRLPIDRLTGLATNATQIEACPPGETTLMTHHIVDPGVTQPYVDALALQTQNDDISRLATVARTLPPQSDTASGAVQSTALGVAQRAAILTAGSMAGVSIDAALRQAGRQVDHLCYSYAKPSVSTPGGVETVSALASRPFLTALRASGDQAANVALSMTGAPAVSLAAAAQSVFRTLPAGTGSSDAVPRRLAAVGSSAYQSLETDDGPAVRSITRSYLDSVASGKFGDSQLPAFAKLVQGLVEQEPDERGKALLEVAGLRQLRKTSSDVTEQQFIGMLGQRLLETRDDASLAPAEKIATLLATSDNDEVAATASLALMTNSPEPSLRRPAFEEAFKAAAQA